MIAVLIISYLVYICRGVPDPIIGAAWPLIYTEFGVSVSLISVITIIIAVFTAIACSVSSGIVAKFGTFKTLSGSLAVMALSVLGFGFSNDFLTLCLISVPFGFATGVMDSALNSYLAVRYKAIYLNLLHGIGCIGAILSPMLVSVAISYKDNWRYGFFLTFCVVASVWSVLMFSMSAWKKSSCSGDKSEEGVVISLKEQFKNRNLIFICMIIACTSILEYAVGVWGSTFFTDSCMISPEISSSLVTSFYTGMAVGRFLISAFLVKIDYRKLLKVMISCMSVLCVVLFFNPDVVALFVLMFLFGMTNGPIFPLIVSFTPEIVGKIKAQSIIGTEITFAYVGCLFTHISLGFLVKYFSIGILPIYVIVSYILMVVVFYLFVRQTDSK